MRKEVEKVENKKIRAVYTTETIRVYQAYAGDIAREAVRLGTFGPKFKMDRMTWIKPSFLWMMYRSGWGTKENQEHTLAIELRREGFDHMVKNAVLSSYQEGVYDSYEEWRSRIQNSDIRCQWDPERDISGNALNHRSIQIGLRREALRRYVHEWIVKLTDITEYVDDLRRRKEMGQDITDLLPDEKIYPPEESTKDRENRSAFW